MSERLHRIIDIHLDPRWGSPYWLRRQRRLGFSIRERVRSFADLDALGPFELDALRSCPVEDFVPRSVASGAQLVLGETGGTTGVPRSTAYTEAEFHAAFVAPFLTCVDCAKTFDGGHWLWLGPGGPHIIGKAAQQIARLTTSSDAFSVDFDPRWYRQLTPGTMARRRYLEHILQQALQVLRRQDVRYLFCTLAVLAELRSRLSERARAAIRFIYLGGMPVGADALAALAEDFPAAQFLSGYGNSLFGVSHERAPGRPNGTAARYFPASERLRIRLVALDGGSDHERLRRDVAYGEPGQVVMYRLDESSFLPGVMERDCAVRLRPAARGGRYDGLGDPQPLETGKLKIDCGIY